MKATGIVRRIDDLGRVVIPKEIRRTLRIREGEPLEIFTDREGEVILKKYSPIGEMNTFAQQYAESLALTIGNLVCITDKEQVIAAAGSGKKGLYEKKLHEKMEETIEKREMLHAALGEKGYIPFVEGQEEEYASQIICPVIAQGDAVGAVVLLEKNAKTPFGETEKKLISCAADFIGRQMEQ